MSGEAAAFRVDETLLDVDPVSGRPSRIVQQSDELLTLLYSPTGYDDQQPHNEDEIYVVARGTATLVVGDESLPLATGDAAFVPAKADHRFEAMTDDFAVWAVFPGKI